ncbi:hypothetical protein [Methylomusa anaerophila]|uniref:Uncharacterized protein n=1 Tax=Methylomusa anaerophila TaxID=1930071 RepID=A0A348AQR8_9FIRM|nr:hypothetical protein [Methylomusa anaerophila]BBB93416.1 hypothetical protein MAMMFC1_04133 [Methylomusa anaerophila]
MKETLLVNRVKPYSEIIELTPWDFCDNSLLPRAIVRHCCDVHQRHLGHYYWNIFNRIQDKKVTYEIPLINFTILNKDLNFLDERRLIFETRAWTINNRSMLQIKIDIYKSVYPFDVIATCSCLGAECVHNDPNDWVLGEFTDTPQIIKELADILPEAEESIVENTQSIINLLESEGEWIGNVTTKHTMVEDYCEYGYMAAFMNYLTPLIGIARRELIKELGLQGKVIIPDELSTKKNYKNWKLWLSIKKAFFLEDEIEINSSYMSVNGKHYLKHELYLKRPKILKQIILEEYSC